MMEIIIPIVILTIIYGIIWLCTPNSAKYIYNCDWRNANFEKKKLKKVLEYVVKMTYTR